MEVCQIYSGHECSQMFNFNYLKLHCKNNLLTSLKTILTKKQHPQKSKQNKISVWKICQIYKVQRTRQVYSLV